MIEKILPGAVACAEAFGDPPDAMLFPEEEAAVQQAVDKRRREFRTVRHCARQALHELGLPPAAILPGPRREPQWPSGVVGSMTHCPGYRGAALAHSRDVLTIGIDAEPHEPLPSGVLECIALEDERSRIGDLTAVHNLQCWDRLLFCAKETVYKAWFPLAHSWLGFDEAHITIDPDQGTFSARLLVKGPTVDGAELRGFEGRWLICDGLVLAGIVVPAPAAVSQSVTAAR